MKNVHLRALRLDELENIFKDIVDQFEEGEYPPYEILYSQLDRGAQVGWIMERDGVSTGYVICADGSKSGYVLISLLGVYKNYQSEGIGLKTLEALKQHYKDKKGLIVEVERPKDALNDIDLEVRRRRIRFYERAGFVLNDSLEYEIWNVPMHLMVCPFSKVDTLHYKTLETLTDEMLGSIIYEIYSTLMSPAFMHMLKISHKTFKDPSII